MIERLITLKYSMNLSCGHYATAIYHLHSIVIWNWIEKEVLVILLWPTQ